jgi:hypothetical protein
MSTVAYAKMTIARESAKPSTSSTSEPPGVKTYVDTLAALVPAEVLGLHAVILPLTTTKSGDTTTISDPDTLAWSFWGLLVLAVLLYVFARRYTNNQGKWDRLDWIRMLIPAAAFVGWTMLQRATAFDAVCPDLRHGPRSVIALFLAVVLGAIAAILASKADQKPPP